MYRRICVYRRWLFHIDRLIAYVMTMPRAYAHTNTCALTQDNRILYNYYYFLSYFFFFIFLHSCWPGTNSKPFNRTHVRSNKMWNAKCEMSEWRHVLPQRKRYTLHSIWQLAVRHWHEWTRDTSVAIIPFLFCAFQWTSCDLFCVVREWIKPENVFIDLKR